MDLGWSAANPRQIRGGSANTKIQVLTVELSVWWTLHFSIRARPTLFYDLWRTTWKKNSKIFRVKVSSTEDRHTLTNSNFFVLPFPCTKTQFSKLTIFFKLTNLFQTQTFLVGHAHSRVVKVPVPLTVPAVSAMPSVPRSRHNMALDMHWFYRK